MTDAEHDTRTDPQTLLASFRAAGVSDRRPRLPACGYCRQMGRMLPDDARLLRPAIRVMLFDERSDQSHRLPEPESMLHSAAFRACAHDEASRCATGR